MEDWWFRRARHKLDTSITPEPSLIKRQQGLAISSLTQTDTEHLREFNDLYEKFGEFWTNDYANQLFPDVAFLAVPLTGNKRDMQKLVRQQLDLAFAQVGQRKPAAKYVMRKTKMELRTFKILLYAVRKQALLKSNDKNSKLSQLDIEITKKFREKPKSGRDGEVQTSGRLLTALRISEWAARMDFPKQTKWTRSVLRTDPTNRFPLRRWICQTPIGHLSLSFHGPSLLNKSRRAIFQLPDVSWFKKPIVDDSVFIALRSFLLLPTK